MKLSAQCFDMLDTLHCMLENCQTQPAFRGFEGSHILSNGLDPPLKQRNETQNGSSRKTALPTGRSTSEEIESNRIELS